MLSNLVTEKQATALDCPFKQSEGCCKASACAAWRWVSDCRKVDGKDVWYDGWPAPTPPKSRSEFAKIGEAIGYCGAAGLPWELLPA